MGNLAYLIIHCTDTPEGQEVTRENILDWHTAPKPSGRGWSKAGYADLIAQDGKLVSIHPFDADDEISPWEVTNGVRGINGKARHVCYVGGRDEQFNICDTRTYGQNKTLETYVKYMVLRHPSIKVAGHNHFNKSKACPSFDVAHWCREIGIKPENILV